MKAHNLEEKPILSADFEMPHRTQVNALSIAAKLGTPTRLKTWSLIVTFFGDAVLPRGGSISAISLGQVMERIGIEAGAVRTAISRLASDGWIERERDGRASFYRLACDREEAFREAAERIYASGAVSAGEGTWAICALPAESTFAPTDCAGMLALGKNWFLADLSRIKQADLPQCMMVFAGDFFQKPSWFLDLIAPREQALAMERLLAVFQPLKQQIEAGWLPDRLEAMALRCLLIHDWRRIALKLNTVPTVLQPTDWPEAECRNLVMSLYSDLLPVSEEWLDVEAYSLAGKLKREPGALIGRFV